MRRKWLRTALWVLLTPIILFIILMILLYVPPVQNLIRKQATAIASGATGMDISVERIDLRFPLNLLVRGVLVVQPADSAVDVQHPDTLLNLGSLNVRVQAWPLLPSDSCPYKNTNRQMQDEQHDSTYCPDHLFSPVLLLPVSSSSICLHTSPACFSLARMFGRASLSV